MREKYERIAAALRREFHVDVQTSADGVAYQMAYLSPKMIKAVRERFYELLELEGLQMTEMMEQEQRQMNSSFICGTEGRELPE